MKRIILGIVAVFLAVGLYNYVHSSPLGVALSPDSSTPTTTPARLASVKTVQVLHPRGYERERDFGRAWGYDYDHNGCDTRDDILRRDLTDVRTDGCEVTSGVLHDRYTGKTIAFHRGPGSSLAVQIDHLVPLKRAWSLGAYAWPQSRREAYANDPAVLLAADGSSNEAKSDQGPDGWRPRRAEWCDYARRYTAVLVKYHLPETPAARSELATMLGTC